ncbi:sporulation protein YqfD [Psychrobacillus sp. NPDC058041]|uniref:sporulation protein YqfD n=1 Tax=Psychrobacillus sp. NPDC058041 TaxID=3346310 RepID=UPI0036DF9181
MQQLIQVKVPIKTDQHLLFQRLFSANIEIYQVYSTQHYLFFSIRKKDLAIFRKVRRSLRLTVRLDEKKKKGIIATHSFSIFGIALFLIIPVILAQFIWSIQIETDSPESDILIAEELKVMNIKEKMRTSTLPSEQEIRQKILLKHKEYSWVHFTKSGSKFIVSPMLAPIQSEREIKNSPPTHLIAKRSGVITDFELVKGVRAVEKNVSVNKGDILVNGFVTQGDKRIITSAEGKVFANYWLELEFEIPQKVSFMKPNERKLVIQKKGNKKHDYWKEISLPSPLQKYLEVGYVRNLEEERFLLNEQSMEKLIRPLLYQKIFNELPTGTQILEDKILQVTIQNDKVKGKVLFLINENIAIPQVIPQGDEA